MPSSSPAQERTMRAAAHNKEFRDKLGIPKKVAEDFSNADERKRSRTEDTAKKANDQAMTPEIYKALHGE